MADDVVDTIAQYDLDDDFPDYANEQNKELNQIVILPHSHYRFNILYSLGQRKSQIGCLTRP